MQAADIRRSNPSGENPWIFATSLCKGGMSNASLSCVCCNGGMGRQYITLLRAYYQLCASAMRTMSPLAMGAELVVMT